MNAFIHSIVIIIIVIVIIKACVSDVLLIVILCYGLIGWVGVGIKYSKPFFCICKHTATRPHAYDAYGGAAQLR